MTSYVGTTGDDVLTGTSGSDSFDLSQGGNDTVNGQGGDDSFTLGGALTTADRIDGGSGNDRLVLDGDYSWVNAVVFTSATMTNIETLEVKDGHSYVLVLADGNVAAGQTFTVDASALTQFFGLNLDATALTAGTLSVTGGAGDDSIAVAGSGSTVKGGAGYDSLWLDIHNIATPISFTFDGSTGNSLTLQDGSTFSSIEHLRLLTGSGNDSIRFNNATFTPQYTNQNEQYWDGGAGNDTATIDLSSTTYMLNGNVNGTSFAIDAAVPELGAAFIHERTLSTQNVENFNILCGSASDYIVTGGGNDSINGGAGDDTLAGGAGNDTLDGGSGTDTAKFSGNRAAYVVTANANGSYTVIGTDGTDTLTNIEILSFDDQSLSPANAASSNPSGQTISGTAGPDTLTGTGGNDTINGGAGNDIINGGPGVDTLNGGDDQDTITGGAGNDAIDGGSSVDTAVFAGNKSAYTITQTSTGNFTIAGPDGSDTLTNIEYAKFDDQTMRLLPGSGTTVNFAADPSTYMGAIRDFDGNDLGGSASWKLIGTADVNGDGTVEHILFNKQIGRWAEVGTEADGKTYFTNNGWAGDTRVVGIYIDPLVANGQVVKGSDTDSQRRFQNDLMIDNIHGILGQGDYNHDGLQEIYFSLTDGTAYLHAYMHADGNIQYANYQNKQQVIDYLTSNGISSSTWSGWFPSGQSVMAAVTG